MLCFNARCAETCTKTNMVMIFGEITVNGKINYGLPLRVWSESAALAEC